MFENPRRSRQARNFTENDPKILDLKSSTEHRIFRKLSLRAPEKSARKIGGNTFMAAFLLFWNFYMAAVRSCHNALYNGYHLHVYAYIPMYVFGVVKGLDPTSFVASSWNSYTVEHSIKIL